MYIKRDYSQPFFGGRRRRRNYGRPLLMIGLLAVVLLIFVYTQFDQLRVVALDVMGLSPTATPLPSELATQAATLARNGDIAGAAALFARAIEQRPDSVDYLYEYGQLLIELEEYEQAAALGTRAIERAPSDPRGYALKTKALVWSGDASAAIPIGLVGQEINPFFAPMHSALSRAYIGVGRYVDGLKAAERAVELDPTDPDAHRTYAYALAFFGENQEAINQLEQAISLNPYWLAPYFELAYQYLALNLDQDAIDTYDRILALQPRNARALLRQCQAYTKVGQFDRALGFCEDAARLAPDYNAAQLQLGIMRYNRREFEGARAAFQQCVNNDATNLDCLYRLGLSHYYLGNCDEAWTLLQNSLVMAQSRTGLDAAIENIRQGLTAITKDCPAYAGLLQPTPIPPPAG